MSNTLGKPGTPDGPSWEDAHPRWFKFGQVLAVLLVVTIGTAVVTGLAWGTAWMVTHFPTF